MTDTPNGTGRFDPAKHITQIRSGNGPPADYLAVKWRVMWFRDVYPEGTIDTEHITLNDNQAVFRARVCQVSDGMVRGTATGYGSETAGDFRDYIEKAETKAVGRALATLGYGTQYIPDDGDRIADSPVDRPAPRPGVMSEGATEPQKKFLASLARDARLDRVALDALSEEVAAQPVSALTRKGASDVIEALQQMIADGAPDPVPLSPTLPEQVEQVWLAAIRDADDMGRLTTLGVELAEAQIKTPAIEKAWKERRRTLREG